MAEVQSGWRWPGRLGNAVQKEELRSPGRPLPHPTSLVHASRASIPTPHGVPLAKTYPWRVRTRHRAWARVRRPVIGTDLTHTPVVGGEKGSPDLIAFPEPLDDDPPPLGSQASLAVSPTSTPVGEHPPPADPRGACAPGRRRLREKARLRSCRGTGARFFLCERDPKSPNGVRRYVDNLEHRLHGRPAGRSPRRRCVGSQRHSRPSRAWGFVRGQPRVYETAAVRDQPSACPALNGLRRAFPISEGSRCEEDLARDSRPRSHVHGRPFNDQGGTGFTSHFSLETTTATMPSPTTTTPTAFLRRFRYLRPASWPRPGLNSVS